MTLEIPDVQNPTMAYARKLGWLAWRMQIIGRNGCPDAFFFRDGRLVIVEFKTDRGRVSPQQERRHKELRQSGFEVYVIDSYVKGKRLFDGFEE